MVDIISIIRKTFPTAKLTDQDILNIEKIFSNNYKRLSGFFSQLGHESAGFSVMEENLNYSAKRLYEVFPKYFPNIESAKDYAYNPIKIANKIYSNRMGNGSELSGDGYNFRGRGFIQLTGKDNYSKCSKAINIDIVNNPDLLLQTNNALLSAIWYWDSRNCSQYCDAEDIVGLTKAINGGTNGLQHRIELFNTLMTEFNKKTDSYYRHL
jgi:putative chitinase